MFPNKASEFVYTRTYSRWLDDKNRRELWPETVDRYIEFITKHRGELIPPKVLKKIKENILNFNVMPSMRALWAAGPAAEFDNTCLYNCSFLNVDSIESFGEGLYVLMNGAGQGFSVENKYIEKLPSVPVFEQYNSVNSYLVEDTKAGWADSVTHLMRTLYKGEHINIDYSKLRPKGAKLKTMGGRSSGPEPLVILHKFIQEMFANAQGRKLTSLECHDIMNQIAESVVVGGVRRSSQVSLSDLNDELMRNAKNWPFPPRRSMANNSAMYYTKPNATEFLKEWANLASSGTGERGISNFSNHYSVPKRRDKSLISGANPCFEILLRSKQFCNLSEIVIKKDDDLLSLLEKIETATWIGVIQSTFTYFPYLSKEWKKNCEEERLLGVSLTGQMDNPEILTEDVLKALKSKAIKVAKHAAQKMNINVPTAITCVKPSGTVSQLVDSSSGIHARYSDYYIRRYRISATDPLFKLIKDQGLKVSPENGQEKLKEDEINTWVISFPVKAPEGSITRDKMNALQQLEWYKKVQSNWCEHNASMTVYVKDDEWFEVGNWIYKNWDVVNGVSFLPYDGGKYKQAPYEEITKKQYEEILKEFPKIDYTQLYKYETEDNTEGAKSYNCTGDRCEIT